MLRALRKKVETGFLQTALRMACSAPMTDIPDSWRPALAPVLATPPLRALGTWLRAEEAAGKVIYPPRGARLAALALTPLDKVRVVILGQDPYHGAGQAHGLAFSVQPGVRVPPSLANIYKELNADLGLAPAPHGDLESWARQGVLLLNNALTVEHALPGSHQKRGWETFTDAAIKAVNAQPNPVVFVLWGGYAQKKLPLIDATRHTIIQSVHPSPLSARNGFFGSRPFSKINAALKEHGTAEIDWQIANI